MMPIDSSMRGRCVLGSMPNMSGVRDQRAGPDAEHDAAAREVVEQHHAVRHHERVVVRQRDDAGAELDVLRALRGDADEHLRRGDDLPAGAVVLADPGLVEAEVVEPLQQLQVALQGQRRVLAELVEGSHERTELEA